MDFEKENVGTCPVCNRRFPADRFYKVEVSVATECLVDHIDFGNETRLGVMCFDCAENLESRVFDATWLTAGVKEVFR